MIVILDNGHGADTFGKRSPEGMLTDSGVTALFEYEFNRDIVERLIKLLDAHDIDFYELVPERHDVSLPVRVERANKVWDKTRGRAFLVSIHANAGGGTGWEVFTSLGQTESDKIAQIFAEKAVKHFPEFSMRWDQVDGDFDKEAQFYILKYTKCPAILTENFFMDHEKDLKFILSNEGRQRIAEHHFDSLRTYMEL